MKVINGKRVKQMKYLLLICLCLAACSDSPPAVVAGKCAGANTLGKWTTLQGPDNTVQTIEFFEDCTVTDSWCGSKTYLQAPTDSDALAVVTNSNHNVGCLTDGSYYCEYTVDAHSLHMTCGLEWVANFAR
jgi:hypothetical protein